MMTKTTDGLYAHVPFRTPADAVAAINSPEDRVSVSVGEIRTREEKSALVQFLNGIPRPYGVVIVRAINPPRNEHAD